MSQKTEYNTPMMRQYMAIKNEHKEEVLFFRMGDFYEMFFDDAIYASKVLGIALTKRQDGIPMCGVPHHAVSNYIHPILEDGKNIAVCDQMEKPEEAEGSIVRREVVRIITPGTIFEENLLEQNESRFIASCYYDKNSGTHYATADISTGDIWLEKSMDLPGFSSLSQNGIREVVADEDSQDFQSGKNEIPVYFRRLPPEAKKIDLLKKAFLVENIQVLEMDEPQINALALLLLYVYEVIPGLNIHWKQPQKEYLRQIMHLDETAIKTLEIVKSQSGEKENSLLGVLDKTTTAAGRRLLIQFLLKPSTDVSEIKKRQEAVQYFLENNEQAESLKKQLQHSYDMERLILLLQNHPQVRHLGNVLTSLQVIKAVKNDLLNLEGLPQPIKQLWSDHEYPQAVFESLTNALYMEDLPPLLDDRRFVRPGYNKELDELLEMGGSAGDVILDFEKKEKARLDINSLKVRYNKVIGYYIEISKGQADKAPPEYSRRQTLVNGERYTCEELKKLEDKILGSRERIIDLQKSIFEGLVEETLKNISAFRFWADALSYLDVIFSFAQCAKDQDYVCPEITEDGEMEVSESRHPVVENIFVSEVFVPNDIHLNGSNRHLAILTGPNMSGKSTYIRQVGLIQLMAQTGSFVPAKTARIPVVDRIFTRIGAFDRLSKGESTFYVEMAECARIFQNFSSKSLILLDEIGRGTSTFDGISIARSMIEFLNDPEHGRPKTLFATHYGELGNLIKSDRGIVGLTVKVLEEDNKVIFLRKIIEGSADKSYGIYVAQLAGIPGLVIERAQELLKELEEEGIWSREPEFKETAKPQKPKKDSVKKDQLSMF